MSARAERVDAVVSILQDAARNVSELGYLPKSYYKRKTTEALAISDKMLRGDEAQGHALSALRSHIDDLSAAEAETIIRDITTALLGDE